MEVWWTNEKDGKHIIRHGTIMGSALYEPTWFSVIRSDGQIRIKELSELYESREKLLSSLSAESLCVEEG